MSAASTTSNDRYRANLHKIQSGIATKIGLQDTFSTPKHLRVGIDSAHISDAALVRLLIQKGVFTMEEYEKALADESAMEVQRLESELSERLGKNVRLG